MNEGRINKVIRNTKYAIFMKFTETIFAFLLRTIFVRTLSTVYLGINGVFSNILTVLCLMDLGVMSAISFTLYKPLVENDKLKINLLMNLFKKLYRNIGILICLIGFCLTPFLDFILTLPEDLPNIYIIYWLNIGNTAITYFLAYKRILLIADQKAYIDYRISLVFKITRFFALSIVLIVFHNFILYLALDILNTLLCNLVASIQVSKMYPFLKEKINCKLPKQEKDNLWKYMKAGVLNKVGQTVVTSTDNIIISTFISTVTVGLYSNYLLIISGVETCIFMLFSSITSSVGNLSASKDIGIKKTKEVFENLGVVNHIISTISCVGLVSLLNPFIKLWLGDKYLLSQNVVIICVINLYIQLNMNSISNFMGARGDMYYINRYRPLLEAIINLVASILLVKYTNLGIIGVFLGTTISFFFGRLWMDARTLYKYWFKEPFINYIRDYVFKFLITVAISIVSFFICDTIFSFTGNNAIIFIGLMVLTMLISSIALFCIYNRNPSFIYILNIIKRKIRLVK